MKHSNSRESQDKFDEKLLSDFFDQFWGYGSLKADYWFFGMEEGGGDDFRDVQRRLEQWNKRGRESLEDLYQYHKDINVLKWFENKAPLQPTWNRLIRVMLSSKNVNVDKEVIRKYQINHLGRSDGEVALLELLPLPSPSASQWIYGQHTNNPVLSTRKEYTQVIGEKRVGKLSLLFSRYQPKYAKFYGFKYLDWWRKISKSGLSPVNIHGKLAYFGICNKTKIAVTQHPVAMGVALNYFHVVGQKLSEL